MPALLSRPLASLRAFAILLVSALVLAAPRPAGAAFPDGADTFVRSLGDRAIQTLTQENLPRDQMEARFRDIFREAFHVQAIGRFVLGKYWRVATAEERDEFLKLFEELVVRSYAKRFKEYTGEQLQVNGARAETESQAIVTSEIVRPAAPPIKVEWRVGIPQGQNDYRVYDVTIEGISMVVTQRAEFAAVIERRGGTVAGLIQALREKVNELNSSRS